MCTLRNYYTLRNWNKNFIRLTSLKRWLGQWNETNDSITWGIKSVTKINKDWRFAVKWDSEFVIRDWFCFQISAFKIWGIKIYAIWHTKWVFINKNGEYVETKTWWVIEIGAERYNKWDEIRVLEINRRAEVIQRLTEDNDITKNSFSFEEIE